MNSTINLGTSGSYLTEVYEAVVGSGFEHYSWYYSAQEAIDVLNERYVQIIVDSGERTDNNRPLFSIVNVRAKNVSWAIMLLRKEGHPSVNINIDWDDPEEVASVIDADLADMIIQTICLGKVIFA